MNNKGFTLTELLAIVVIIVLISIVAVPSMTKQIKKEEEQMQSILENKIENAAKLYAVKYYASKLIKGNEVVTFTLDDLEKDGLINLQNKCTDNESFKRTTQKIKVKGNTYDFIAIKELKNCYNK